MKDLWEQTTLLYNLPYTLGLAVVTVYWVLTLTLAVSADALGGDGAGESSAEGESGGGGLMSIRRFANAGDVPITIILSVLQAMVWTCSLLANYFFNPDKALGLGFGLAAFSMVPAFLLTKLATQPLVPFMRKLKGTETSKPVIGETGLVKSRSLTHRYGQVEVVRGGEPPALLNCRLPADIEEVPRGTAVMVQSYDEPTGQYIVLPLPSHQLPTTVQPS